MKDIPAFSVQYHPEAAGGPHDANYLFDVFVEKLRNNA
jgi:carbamoyl-phosphate synthase small subunit